MKQLSLFLLLFLTMNFFNYGCSEAVTPPAEDPKDEKPKDPPIPASVVGQESFPKMKK